MAFAMQWEGGRVTPSLQQLQGRNHPAMGVCSHAPPTPFFVLNLVQAPKLQLPLASPTLSHMLF